jgi:hypothetical protein
VTYVREGDVFKWVGEYDPINKIFGHEFIRAGGEEDGTIFNIGQTIYIPIAAWKIKDDPLSIICKYMNKLKEIQDNLTLKIKEYE